MLFRPAARKRERPLPDFADAHPGCCGAVAVYQEPRPQRRPIYAKVRAPIIWLREPSTGAIQLHLGGRHMLYQRVAAISLIAITASFSRESAVAQDCDRYQWACQGWSAGPRSPAPPPRAPLQV